MLEHILTDISHKLSVQHNGRKKGTGTEHLLVTMIDRIKQLQDNPDTPTVILSSYDWMGAFDRIDPTEVITKCILLGVRSSIFKILIDFLNKHKMQVKINNLKSQILAYKGLL